MRLTRRWAANEYKPLGVANGSCKPNASGFSIIITKRKVERQEDMSEEPRTKEAAGRSRLPAHFVRGFFRVLDTAESAERTVPANGKLVTSEPRYLLWIDGVGGFLICMGSRVTIGQATHESHVDIPLYADVSRLHASLTRDSEGYMLEAIRAVLLNGRTVERALLRSHDQLTLGNGCQIEFHMPVPVSATARLDVRSGHRLALAVDGILLMADTLVLGPGSQAHVAIPDLDQAVILYRQKDGLAVRYGGNLSVDGQRCQERALLRPSASVTGDDFALAIEPVGTGLGK